MEPLPHCVAHSERLAEYRCPECKNRPMCEECKQIHETGTKHVLENFKEVGPVIMRQCIQDGIIANEMDKGLIKFAKEFDAGLLREIGRLQSNCMQTEERRDKMQKLYSEGKCTELYAYVKKLTTDSAKNQAETGEPNKRFLEMFEKASKELKKVLNGTVAQYKPVFAAYKKEEVLVLKEESHPKEETVISALKTTDMSKLKAMYINSCFAVGDRVVSELASHLLAHPVSALYLAGFNISDADAELLAQAAFRGKSLSAFCIESRIVSDTGAKAVAKAIRNCRSLTTLYLFGWKISDSGAIAIAEAVKGCPLSVFYLAGGRISDAGAILVAEAVKDCPLSAFCLWGHEMSDSGVISVAKTMKDCPLSAFHLGSALISDAGAMAVANMISSGGCTSTLFAFDLRCGNISDPGAKKLSDVIRGCPLLSELYFDGKPISGETVAYILKSMADVRTIRSVNLSINEISKEQMDSCLERVQKNGVAKQLKIRFRCVTEAAQSVCKNYEAEWNAKIAEFSVVPYINDLFSAEVIIGMPK